MKIGPKLKFTLWILGGLCLGAILGGTAGGFIVWFDIRDQPSGWGGVFVLAGVLTAGIIGSAIGLIVGVAAVIISIRRNRKRPLRR